MPRSKATSTPDRRVRPVSSIPQYRFVGGKGGVGKTTCAAAMAIMSARRGVDTLIISTDPAPSLGDALGQRLGGRPRPVRGVRRLHAVEVDAGQALAIYVESRRATLEEIALRGTWLDREDVARLLALSLPGIDEVAALLQIAAFGRDGRYQHIVVDTAPTGHLLRMLETPAILQGLAQVFDHMQGKHRVMVDALRGAWIPDAADRLIEEVARDADDLKSLLRDSARAQLMWITVPERMAVEETADGIRWLRDHGIVIEGLIVNRLTPAPPGPCRWCEARRRAEFGALRTLKRGVPRGLDHVVVPALDREPRGLRALVTIGKLLEKPPRIDPSSNAATRSTVAAIGPAMAADLRNRVEIIGATRLVMFGGKGGVGKTTCAAAAAIDAAEAAPARRVLLLSADPAHSIGDALGERLSDTPRQIRGGPGNLEARELDATAVFGALRDRLASGIEELFARVSGGGIAGSLATHDRQVMRNLMELAPPGVDELVAIIEVIDTLVDPPGVADTTPRAMRFDLVVMDTAPTGHALRLLEMPGLVHDWVKAIMAILLKYQPIVGLGDLGAVMLRLSQGLGRLRDVLSDPVHTRFVAVTRAAALPRLETVRLLERLATVSIAAPIVIVNAAGGGTCRRCERDRRAQRSEIAALQRSLRTVGRPRGAVLIAPGELPPPQGLARLRRWRRTWREIEGRRPGAARRLP